MLTVNKLTAGYGESMVLRDIDIVVPPHSVVTVMGSNGVGKSTLLKCVMGLIKPAAGTVGFEASDITSHPSSARAALGIGYVPQGRDIFPFLTVHENLVLGLEARKVSAVSAEAKAGEMYDLFPALQDLKKRKGGDLSGGQQQILALARILVTSPRLLILDEPTEGIQPSIVQAIEGAIGRIRAAGVSVLLVEQFADFALAHADHYYLMEHGLITRQGQVTADNRAAIRESISI